MRHLHLILLVAPFTFPTSASSQWQGGGVPISTTNVLQSPLTIDSDGANGAVILWCTYESDLHAQRVNGAGVKLWGPNGTAICTAPGNQLNGGVVPDESGGFILVWDDQRAGLRDVYAQRVDASGNALWATNGVPVCVFTGTQSGPYAVADGFGGVFIVWTDQRAGQADIYMQRIDGNGTPQWTVNGIPICTAPNVQAAEMILPTETGDVIVEWFDRRNGGQMDLYAQRVDLAGSVEWTSDGVAICTAVGDERTSVGISDGADGAIFAWWDRRDPNDSGDIFVQRINASGTAVWGTDGINLCDNPSWQLSPKIVSDGSGGAIVAWTDYRNDGQIFAQRVDASGLAQWGNDGTSVASGQYSAWNNDVVADGAGGAIVSWSDGRNGLFDVYAQKLDPTGAALWNPSGVLVSHVDDWVDEMDAVLAPNGSGGAIVSWLAYLGELSIYAQQVDSGGTPTSVSTPSLTPALRVSNAHPNPFSSVTSFDLDLRASANVAVEVFNVAGERVRSHQLGDLSEGLKTITFDGRDDDGRALPSGVYFYRFKTAKDSMTRKVVITR